MLPARMAEPLPTEVPAPRSLWRHVRDSLRGEHHDYTTGSLPAAILLLAVPMVLEMALESTFALVDIWWVRASAPSSPSGPSAPCG